MKDFNELDELFKDSFENFEVIPPDSVKESIDQKIEHKKGGWFWFSAILSLLVVLGTLIYLSNDRPSHLHSQTKTNLNSRIKTINETSSTPLISSNSTANSAKGTDIQHNKNSNFSGSLQNSNSNINHNKPRNKEILLNKSVVAQTLIPTKVPSNSLSSFSDVNAMAQSSLTSLNKENADGGSIIEKNQKQIESTEEQTSKSMLSNEDAQAELIKKSENVESSDSKNESASASIVQSQVDSLKTESETISSSIAPKSKTNRPWIVAGVIQYGHESSKDTEFDPSTFNSGSQSRIGVTGNSFGARVEIGKRIRHNYSVNSGIGYSLTKLTQSENQYQWDSTLISQNYVYTTDSLGNPDSVLVSNYSKELMKSQFTEGFTVQRFILPISFSGNYSINEKWGVGLAVGADFSFATVKRTGENNNGITIPTIKKIGASGWVRPEVNYAFSKFQLVLFGSMQYQFIDHVSWNMDYKRKPIYGGGISLRWQF